MIWIVSKRVDKTSQELDNRHNFIEEITELPATPWKEESCKNGVKYYRCCTKKGEYGVIITAHINTEVQPILKSILQKKKAIVIINTCSLQEKTKNICKEIIKNASPYSEVFFAKQNFLINGYSFNSIENVGTFGFGTTKSERELFQNRKKGLIKAIHLSFEKW